jgi:hypothetical protein
MGTTKSNQPPAFAINLTCAAYGKWPSFIYLVFVALLRPRLFFVISAAYFAAYHHR